MQSALFDQAYREREAKIEKIQKETGEIDVDTIQKIIETEKLRDVPPDSVNVSV